MVRSGKWRRFLASGRWRRWNYKALRFRLGVLLLLEKRLILALGGLLSFCAVAFCFSSSAICGFLTITIALFLSTFPVGIRNYRGAGLER